MSGRLINVIVVAAGCLLLGVPAAMANGPVFGIESFSNSFAELPFSEEGIETETPALKEPFLDRGGIALSQAGGHPFAMTTIVIFNHIVEEEEVIDPGGSPEETVPTKVLASSSPRSVTTNVPPGLVLNPQATTGHCEETTLDSVSGCPASSAVGVLAAYVTGFPDRVIVPLYNMMAPAGVPAQFGANVAGLGYVIHLNGRVRTLSPQQGGYGLSGEVTSISASHPIYAIVATFWGNPSDPAHDAMRGVCGEEVPYRKTEGSGASCPLEPSEASETAFVRMPTSCPAAPLATSITVESWKDFGVLFPATATSPTTTGCGALEFAPTIKAQPETSAASSATGLTFDLHISQENKVDGLSAADLKDTVVTLPEGMTINPSAADGLAACQLLKGAEGSRGEKGINLETTDPAHCPNTSKLGEVQVTTPLLKGPLPGSVYLAAQESNPFGSLIAIYLAIDDHERGIVIKLAGRVEPDPTTGQLTTTFTNNPQLPFEDLKLQLFGGPTERAPLVTPASCGTATTTSRLTPWSSSTTATPSTSFNINEGCSHTFTPSFTGGTTSRQGGAFSPFTMTISRNDSEQDFKGIEQTFPPGLLAKLAGVPLCGDTQASEGACPAASQIGTVQAAAGAGPHPVYVKGQIYLTGPYHSGPFGVAVEVPAVAGPFNLDENGRPVTVRGSIRINSSTAQATVMSDSFPQKLRGIPLHLRKVNVTLNRPNFIFNPTNCTPASVTATLTSTQGATAPVSSPFEAANCASLPFAPKLTASVGSHASKLNGTNFNVKLQSAGIGQANIRKVELRLPRALPSRLTTLQKACLVAIFEANPAGCGLESIIGHATIHTPTLNSPLTGPAYLVSHGGAAFPDVEFVLQGEGVTLILDGKTDIKHGITYSKFETAPDAPFATFETELPAGPHSILTANTPKTPYNLCRTSLAMPTEIVGQNGAVIKKTTTIATPGCPPTPQITKTTINDSTVKVTVKLRERGTVQITGKSLKSTTKKGLKVGTHTIAVRLSPAGKIARRHHHKIKLRLTEIVAGKTGSTVATLKT